MEGNVQCNGVFLKIITEGRGPNESLAEFGHKDLVLVIPGNPGIPGFYAQFTKSLKTRLPIEVPVWIVGHAGHVQLIQHSVTTSLVGDVSKKYFNLDDQIEQKIYFIEKYIPTNAKLHIVAHSIGAWITLKLLEKKVLSKRVVKCYFLFPTIEHMAESPSGRFLNRFLPLLSPILIYIAWIISFFPQFVLVALVKLIGTFYGLRSDIIPAVLQLINPSVLDQVFQLALEELRIVREPDDNTIEKYSNRLFFYYGATDHWTPISYYEKFKLKHPTVEAELCQKGFCHAFVLNSSREIGIMIGDMINKTII